MLTHKNLRGIALGFDKWPESWMGTKEDLEICGIS